MKTGANADPTVVITSPVNNSTSAPGNITINATAKDFDGSTSKVEFFKDGVKIGESLTSPYQITFSATSGQNISLTAKATDNFGAVTTSFPVVVMLNTTGIVNPADLKNINVYPNPSSGAFTIEILNTTGDQSMQIYNSMGKEVDNLKISSVNNKVDLKLTTGIYYVVISSAEGNMTRKIIVQ